MEYHSTSVFELEAFETFVVCHLLEPRGTLLSPGTKEVQDNIGKADGHKDQSHGDYSVRKHEGLHVAAT